MLIFDRFEQLLCFQPVLFGRLNCSVNGNFERSSTPAISDTRVGTRLQQLQAAFRVQVLGCDVKGTFAVIIQIVHVSSTRQQEGNSLVDS